MLILCIIEIQTQTYKKPPLHMPHRDASILVKKIMY